MIGITRILCPVDFSMFSERALNFAMRMSVWYGSRLHVLHVMPPPTAGDPAATGRAMAAKHMAAAVERQRIAGADVTTEIIESAEPAERIIDYAEAFDADLVVMGSHGRRGVERVLLGSVVEALLHRSARPVLVIPSHLDEERASQPLRFERIVCGVDFSTPSINALALALAIAEESDSKLTLLHVIDVPPEFSHHPEPPLFDIDRIRAEAEAERLTALRTLIPAHARDYCTIETAVLEGGVSRQLLRMALARSADLIVLGVHGRNAFNLAFFGSNSKDVIRQAHCPVLVVPAIHRASMKAAS